jgi:hypothetical protein
MGKTTIYSYRIPSFLVCGIEYGGFDDLNDDEIAAIKEFWEVCNALVTENNGNSYSIDYSEDNYFSLFESPFTKVAYSGDVIDATITII